jgi:hypothetical protein
MRAEREMKVARIKDEIAQGSYRVNPTAVADAIVRRMRERALVTGVPARAPGRPSVAGARQNECS